MLKALIVDDEKHSANLLKSLIEEYCDDVTIEGIADNIDAAYKLINATSPDFVLLDIYMPPTNSFELLKRFKDINFEIIFTTAFEEYAMEAIKQSPVDYLLKPIDPDELYAAIQKVKKKVLASKSSSVEERRVLLNTDKSYLIVSVTDIVRIESDNKGTAFVLKNKTVHRTAKGIAEYEDALSSRLFFRTHRSHIININEVKEYIPEKNGGCIIMSDGKLIPLAIRRKADFMLYFLDKQI